MPVPLFAENITFASPLFAENTDLTLCKRLSALCREYTLSCLAPLLPLRKRTGGCTSRSHFLGNDTQPGVVGRRYVPCGFVDARGVETIESQNVVQGLVALVHEGRPICCVQNAVFAAPVWRVLLVLAVQPLPDKMEGMVLVRCRCGFGRSAPFEAFLVDLGALIAPGFAPLTHGIFVD